MGRCCGAWSAWTRVRHEELKCVNSRTVNGLGNMDAINGAINDMSNQARLKSRDLTAAQVAPLESSLPKGTPEVWRELALSLFITLLSLREWRSMTEAELAAKGAAGLGEDLGGTQPYIPVGNQPSALDRKKQVLELLAKGGGYREAAYAVGLTEARVRKIEAEHRAAARKAQQKSH